MKDDFLNLMNLKNIVESLYSVLKLSFHEIYNFIVFVEYFLEKIVYPNSKF